MTRSTKKGREPSKKNPAKKGDKKKEPEVPGLLDAEQPLLYMGPPPALRILHSNRTDFDPKFHPQYLLKHMQEGSSRSEICAAWGVKYGTFNDWLEKYPEFAEAYAVGKPAYDGYYKRALRYSAFGQLLRVKENSLFFMLKNAAGFTDDGGDHEFGDGVSAELDFVDDGDQETA